MLAKTLRPQFLRAAVPLRAALSPAARGLRVSAPVQQSDVAQRFPGSGAVTTIDPSKFVDGESLVAHQARVRHDNPSNRTFNYAMIGAFRLSPSAAAPTPFSLALPPLLLAAPLRRCAAAPPAGTPASS